MGTADGKWRGVDGVIRSSANPLIKRLRLLGERKHREREGVFVVEGIQPVWQAVEAAAEIETLIVARPLLTSEAALAMVEQQGRRGVPLAEITPELFTSVASRERPSGLAAIVRASRVALGDLPVTADSLFVVLHRVGNPGNLGTIVRTADAVGATGVLLLGETTDPYHPAAVKASMGALFALPVVRGLDVDTFFAWAVSAGITVGATSARATVDHWFADYPAPLALLFGSEAEGLPPELLARANFSVRIPMAGSARSLNLAIAAGVLLYEARRNWATAPR